MTQEERRGGLRFYWMSFTHDYLKAQFPIQQPSCTLAETEAGQMETEEDDDDD